LVVDFKPAAQAPSGKAERAAAAREEAIGIARSQGADAACVVDVRECGWMFSILALPPAWSLDNHLGYSVRVFDAASGKPLLAATRSAATAGSSRCTFRACCPSSNRASATTCARCWPPTASRGAGERSVIAAAGGYNPAP
jgi:hypothetical protein